MTRTVRLTTCTAGSCTAWVGTRGPVHVQPYRRVGADSAKNLHDLLVRLQVLLLGDWVRQARPSHRGGALRRWTHRGNGQSIEQIWWPPPRSSRGRQRSVFGHLRSGSRGRRQAHWLTTVTHAHVDHNSVERRQPRHAANLLRSWDTPAAGSRYHSLRHEPDERVDPRQHRAAVVRCLIIGPRFLGRGRPNAGSLAPGSCRALFREGP